MSEDSQVVSNQTIVDELLRLRELVEKLEGYFPRPGPVAADFGLSADNLNEALSNVLNELSATNRRLEYLVVAISDVAALVSRK